MEYKVGDRVKCVKEYGENPFIVGEYGTVKDFQAGEYGIEFDNHVYGHDLFNESICYNGHGWFIPQDCLEKI